MATVKLKLDWQNPSWVIGNSDVIDEDTIIHLTDGRFARADGITQVQNLTWFGSQSDGTSRVVSGCVVSVGTYGGSGVNNDIKVTAGSYYISGSGSYSSVETPFNDIALAAAGLQRLVGLYGTTSGTITKVEGTEGAVLTLPTQPANTVIIGFVIVTDGAVATSPSSPTIDPIPVDGSSNAVSSNGVFDALATKQSTSEKDATGGYPGLTLFKINFKNALNTFTSFFTNSNTAARTYTFPDADLTVVGHDTTQTLTNKRNTKRRVVVTQSATPTINTDNTDIASITGLAQAITSFTTNLSGTPVAGEMMMIQITDNGTARAITWGASFQSTTVSLPTTTVISTMLRVLFQWNAVASKWDCIAVA